MILSPLSRARWHHHVNATRPSPALRHWLTVATSLTARLQLRAASFRVRLLKQELTMCLDDEKSAIGLTRRQRVLTREVLLYCDEKPVIFAHTIMPLGASARDWPKFGALGERSLGAWLFNDPRVRRGHRSFARLPSAHPLTRRIRAALPQEPIESRLHARRCLFRRKRGLMLVTEVFLPGILTLK